MFRRLAMPALGQAALAPAQPAPVPPQPTVPEPTGSSGRPRPADPAAASVTAVKFSTLLGAFALIAPAFAYMLLRKDIAGVGKKVDALQASLDDVGADDAITA